MLIPPTASPSCSVSNPDLRRSWLDLMLFLFESGFYPVLSGSPWTSKGVA